MKASKEMVRFFDIYLNQLEKGKKQSCDSLLTTITGEDNCAVLQQLRDFKTLAKSLFRKS